MPRKGKKLFMRIKKLKTEKTNKIEELPINVKVTL
jgi:hypothetical protein